jgi:hypothetical protein
MSLASEYQPSPQPGQVEVGPLVIKDIQERIDHGYAKYKTKLMTHNGRSALWDAYQEAIDLVMYLKQAIEEAGNGDGSDKHDQLAP